MAKHKRNKQPLFHEALTAAPRFVEVIQIALPFPHATHENSGNRWRLRSVDVWAAWHDAIHYGGIAAQALMGLWARRLALLAIVCMAGAGTAVAVQVGVATYDKYGKDLNSPAVIMNEKNTGTTILDRNGVVLFQAYGAVDRHNIPLSEMPDSFKKATLAAEDPDFYNHAGFSWRGTARAAYQDAIHSGKVQGGSTITQQLVKKTLLTDEKSFIRKYREVLLSTELERRYTKDQILEMYLNTVYYGQGAYGVESASETYFHKPAKDLSLEESALLAGLPQSPSHYDPTVNPDDAKIRRDYVLSRMDDHHLATSSAITAAKAQPIVAGTRDIVIKAPHFVFYVLGQLRAKYGQDVIENGGITVHTSLDYTKQQKAEQIVRAQVAKLADHHATNGGLVSIDPHNGDVLSMVGSIDYNEPRFGAVNVMLAQLQPGSSFKPIAYATAFSKGWNGATKVDDKPISLPQGDGTQYMPQNYDLKFRGPVTLRRALSNSLNIPAVQVLQFAGVHDTVGMAHNLGIQSPSLDDEGRLGLSLVLGGGEVRPIDMARVYASFANQGRTITPRGINKVSDKFGQDITKPDVKTNTQVLDPRVAFEITSILSDVNSRKEEFGQHNPLELSRPAAAKTGTTNDFRDNWTVGYTPDVVTAVWVGNNDHSAMQNVDGITGAAPIWHEYMEAVLAGTPVHGFTIPAGMVTAKVCNTDGGLVDDSNPSGVAEVFLAEAKPTKRCGGSNPVHVITIPAPPVPQPKPPQAQQAQGPPPQNAPGMGGGPSPNPPSQPPNPPGGGQSSPPPILGNNPSQ